MITLSEFVTKWTGKKCDFDGFYGGQCVDLYRQYVQECLGVPQSPGVQGAKDIWDNYLTEYYDRIPNTPEGVPQPGDIMIWGSKYGQFGHVAVCISANTSSFTCFSQNDPVGTLCITKKYTAWSALLGWLHPRPKTSVYRGYDLSNSDSMKVCVDKMVEIMEGKYISIDEHSKIINELDAKSTASAQSYANEKTILEEKIKALEEVIKQIQDTEHSWSDKADILERKLKAIIFEFQKKGISISIESDENTMVSSISSYLSTLETLQSSNKSLELSLSNASKKVDDLNQVIVNLKKKETAFRTVNLGNIIIKFYKR